ncbi:hypothetical protein PAFU01_30040 [Pantoea ananatis]|nr:hypothetical protein PAFU01_30040 [Pantoea ananatis]
MARQAWIAMDLPATGPARHRQMCGAIIITIALPGAVMSFAVVALYRESTAVKITGLMTGVSVV